jgi:hypothetical protein
MNKMKNKFWAGVLYVWNHPVILAPILLILAYLLFNEIRAQAFTSYLNCNYVLGEGIHFDDTIGGRTWSSVFCEGFTLGIPGVFTVDIPGLAGIFNPVLEFVRTVTVWAVLLFFAFISLLLTLIINNLKTIVKIVTLNREEWKRFGASIVTFLLFFVVFCTLFYFKVMHPNFLNIRMPGY